MTAEEFWERYQDRPDRYDARDYPDGYPDHELWNGVVVEGEVTGYRHQATLAWIHTALDTWVAKKGGHLWPDGGVKVGPQDVRGPDLMAWWSGQAFDPDGMFTAIPDLVVEVISPRPRDVRRDREEKRADYCTHGIPRYWLIEPVNRTFEALHLVRRHGVLRYERVLLATAGCCGNLPGMESFTLDLDACWRTGED